MIHRGLDINRDWVFGKGKNSYWAGNKAIINNIKTRLLSFKWDCFFDLEMGVDWWNLLGGKNQEDLVYQIRSIIATSYGVENIISINYELKQRIFSITFKVKLIDGINAEDSVEVFKNA